MMMMMMMINNDDDEVISSHIYIYTHIHKDEIMDIKTEETIV